MVRLAKQAGFDWNHIPYRGGGPLMQDALGGQVELAVGSEFLVKPYVDSGSVIPLVITTAKRSPALPNVPTVSESGFPGFSAPAWWAVLAPEDAVLHFNAAKALSTLQRDNDALKHHYRALALDPQNPEIWLNYARSLDSLRKYEEALVCYEKAVALQPKMAEGWFNKGKIFGELKRYDEALHSYISAYELRSSEPFLLGVILHYKMLICDWTDLEALYLKIQSDLHAYQKVIEPFGYQRISTSERDLLEAAKIFANHRFPAQPKAASKSAPRVKNQKIRIAYICGEFRDQATSVLMTGVYEAHNSECFEIYALDNGWDDGGILRSRIKNAFKELIDISQMTDDAVVKLIQDL